MAKLDIIARKVGRFTKETGERIIGKGEQVNFRKEVRDLVTTGQTVEQAEKNVLANRLRVLQTELISTGAIDNKSQAWKSFAGSLTEMLSNKSSLNKFLNDSRNAAIFRNIPPLPASAKRGRIRNAQNYYASKFEGRTPNAQVLNQHVDVTFEFDQIVNRLNREITRLSRNPNSLEQILTTGNPEIGADVGKLIALKNSLEKHEMQFELQNKFDLTVAQFRRQSREALAMMVWRAPVDYLTRIAGALSRGRLEALISETARFSYREMASSLRLLFGTAKVTNDFMAKSTKGAFKLY